MAHPAAARDPRSFSSTSPLPPVNRSRSGVRVNQQEQKVVESGDGLLVATASSAGSRRNMTDPVCLSLWAPASPSSVAHQLHPGIPTSPLSSTSSGASEQ